MTVFVACLSQTQRFFSVALISVGVLIAAPVTANDDTYIVQTNAAGDNVHLIDPATRWRVFYS